MNMKRLLIKFVLQFHTFVCRILRKAAVFCNNGVHPRHQLIRYQEFFLNNINKGDILLDVGCGIGIVAKELAAKAGRVVAIDMDKSAIEKAKSKNNLANLEYIHADVTSYHFRDNFDVAVLSNVLEHIEDRIIFLRKVASVCKKILVRVPMVDRDWITLYKKNMGLEYRLDKTHFIEYTYDSFKKEVEAAGLSIYSYYVKFGELYAILARRT